MRGINFLAGLGTILIVIGIFCFKALSQPKTFKEGTAISRPANTSQKIFLILGGTICAIGGLALILKAFKIF